MGPAVVENRPGGDGLSRSRRFSARDDHAFFDRRPRSPHTLICTTNCLTIRATVGCARLRHAISLTAPPQLNVNSSVTRLARASPANELGPAGATDVVIAAFLKREGLDMAKVLPRSGQALNDGRGRLQFYWSSLAMSRRDRGRRVKPAIRPPSHRPWCPEFDATAGFCTAFDGLVCLWNARMPTELREDRNRRPPGPRRSEDRSGCNGGDVVPGSAAEFAADTTRNVRRRRNAVLGLKAAAASSPHAALAGFPFRRGA
jgi:hypothetical protein